MVGLAGMKPIPDVVGKGCVGPVARERNGGEVSVFGKFLLLFGEGALGLQQLELIEVLVESGERRHVYLFDVGFLYGNGLVCGIVDDIFQHVILLDEHGLGIVILHAKVLEIDIDTLHVDAERHVVIMEGLGDVAQFLQALDVVLDNGYLLFGILGEIVHLANLHYQVFLGLGVRERVEMVEGLGDVEGSKCRLAVERHLQLDACRRIVLQRLGNIVRLAISATVGHRYWGSEIVVARVH